jgi:hypothetical protein
MYIVQYLVANLDARVENCQIKLEFAFASAILVLKKKCLMWEGGRGYISQMQIRYSLLT